MADTYSIVGFFDDDNAHSIPFGGFFFFGEDVPGNSCFRNNLTGMLIDDYGYSNIWGQMRPEISLDFNKIYSGRDYDIDYNFEYDSRNGFWVGSYESSRTGGGNTLCHLSLGFKEIRLSRDQLISPEEWAERLVEGIVRDGMLVEVKRDTE